MHLRLPTHPRPPRTSYLSAVGGPAAAGLQLLLLLEQEALVDARLPAHLRLEHGRRALRLRTSELLGRHGQGRLLVQLQDSSINPCSVVRIISQFSK